MSPKAVLDGWLNQAERGAVVADGWLVVVTPTQISIGGTATAPGSKVTMNYPFSLMVLQPVARLVVASSTLGGAFTMSAVAEMRNEQ